MKFDDLYASAVRATNLKSTPDTVYSASDMLAASRKDAGQNGGGDA